MKLEEFREYCLSLNGTSEDTPFGPDTLVFRVGGKIFAFASLDQTNHLYSLKCEPEQSISLRERYPNIIPGYHLNKKLWITITHTKGLEYSLIEELIKDSYSLILNSLPKSQIKTISGE